MYVRSYHSKHQSMEVMKTAIDEGINFIDSANRYGIFDSDLPMEDRTPSEKIIGEFIQDYDRQELILSTKVFHQMSENPNSGGFSRKHIKESIHNSLNNLKTGYVDIYFCHRPDRNSDGKIKTVLEETIHTMTNLIDEGLVHYWGTSWWDPILIERCQGLAKEQGLIGPSVEQPPYHPNARFIENELFEISNYHGMGITSFEALGSGFYTGKYHQTDTIPTGSRATKLEMLPNGIIEKRRPAIAAFQTISDELDVSIAQIVIAWSLRLSQISSSIIGASKPEQIIENAAAVKLSLSKEHIKLIEENTDPLPPNYYR